MKYPARRSLRRFLILWSSAIGIAFLLMAVDAGVAFYRLDAVARNEMQDAKRLALLQKFEVSALEANRQMNPDWREADANWKTLRSAEQNQSRTLAHVFDTYQKIKRLQPKVLSSDESQFLDAVRRVREHQLQQIKDMAYQGGQIERWSRVPIMLLSLTALVGLVAGGAVLWTRVFRPIIAISGMARRFESGDLSARVSIARNDELGELGETFNDMAEAVEARERERLRFVAAVAHDLKNPLVVIGGASAMMRDRPDKFSREEQSEWLGKIARSARSMEVMIYDFTDAVQAQTGTIQLHRNVCDVAMLVREAASETEIAFPAHHILYQGPRNLDLCVDRARFERVCANLLSNAAKYSARGTTIVVQLESRRECVVMEVQDQGAGICPDDLKRLFTPFVRLENTTRMASGTGLGLSTVKKIVEAHGGYLEVESELGKGSIFRVVMPLNLPVAEVTSEKIPVQVS